MEFIFLFQCRGKGNMKSLFMWVLLFQIRFQTCSESSSLRDLPSRQCGSVAGRVGLPNLQVTALTRARLDSTLVSLD